LLEGINPDVLNARLTITNINSSGMEILRRVIANSKKYYSNPSHKKAVDKTIKEASQNL
jgi:lipoate-protein ligase A